nr:MAG TPA: hypothetical protein [Caudoviricetes sp.]
MRLYFSFFLFLFFYFAKKLYFCIPSFFLNPIPVFFRVFRLGILYFLGCYKVAFNSHN